MSRTVGYPVGIAAGLLAEEKITSDRCAQAGPLARSMNPSWLNAERLGIRFKERRSDLDADERSYWGD
jgi:hypothetical protein